MIEHAPSRESLNYEHLALNLVFNFHHAILDNEHPSGSVSDLNEEAALLEVQLLHLVQYLVPHFVLHLLEELHLVKRLLEEQLHIVVVVVDLLFEFGHQLGILMDQLVKVRLGESGHCTVVICYHTR